MPGPLESLARLTQKALEKGGQAVEMPFLAFSLSDDPSHNLRVAASWADAISARVLGSSQPSETRYHDPYRVRANNKARITVGYLSADFKNHATAHLMLGLFGFHDRRHFKIIAYSYGKKDQSEFRHRIEGDCDRFVDIHLSTPQEAARTIASDGVDILVELKGYTEGGRPEICAYRPAPIQVAWLGFPGTSGADFLDYIITDKIVTPQEHAPFFSERFVYLPHTYQVNNNQQEIAEIKCQRQDFNLPPRQFVFCSFNEPYKMEPVMFEIWTKILQDVNHSILWLLAENRVTQDNLKKAAERNGISADRLVFAHKLPKDRHLARLQMADLVLDTRVVNGHTTTSDALWAGVPVLTLKGNHFASRVSASLLSAVGLPELITNSPADYEAQAVRLANYPDQIKSIREKLAENRLTFPLFDTAGFTRDLEKAYREMWRIYLQGKGPRQIEVLSV
jgi:protein O-GlcNAc transferase